MRDPYEILGVARTASQEDVQRAYRKLAKKHHPDVNPGDAAAEERFKEIATAYAIIGDPDKRVRFDRGEIDASGQEMPERGYWRPHGDAAGGAKYGRTRYSEVHEEASAEELERMFADLFGGMGGTRAGGFGAGTERSQRIRLRGQDVTYSLELDFVEAAMGGRRTVTMPDGNSLRITIPQGVRDGQMLRLKGKGGPGYGGGPAGDAYVELHIRPHRHFTRKDSDVHLQLPVSLAEAVLGAKIAVPTIDGPVTMTIPKGSNTGATLRLRGKGIPDQGGAARGDQYVHLKVVLPPKSDPELEELVARWAEAHAYDPRAGLFDEVR